MPLPLCVPVVVPASLLPFSAAPDDDHKKAAAPGGAAALRSYSVALAVLATCALTVWGCWAGGEMQTASSAAMGASPSLGELGTDITSVAAPTQPVLPPDHVAIAHECRRVPMFLDVDHIQRRRDTPRPRISIIFITKRPGGYDILLNSLAQQVGAEEVSYELIAVDEIASMRASKVYSMAEKLRVPLVALLPSKPKTRTNADLKFGIYNAINTGILMARGDIVTFVMDLSWIPHNYLARTAEFYNDPAHAKSLLGYPELFFSMRQQLEHKRIKDQRAVTFFDEELETPFLDAPEKFRAGHGRPEDMVQAFKNKVPLGLEKQPREHVTGGFKFWELSFATCPWSVLEKLNGVEERFDYGDDCHEANIQIRSEFLGYDLWIDGEVVVQNLHHKGSFESPDSEMWNRFAKDSIQDKVILQMPGEIVRGEREARSSGHDFNLTAWRALDCPANL